MFFYYKSSFSWFSALSDVFPTTIFFFATGNRHEIAKNHYSITRQEKY